MRNDKKKKNYENYKNLNKTMNIKIITAFVLGAVISIASSYTLAETLIKSADVSYVDNSKLGATNVQAAIDGTCTKFSNDLTDLKTNLKKEILDEAYPVNSVYISYSNINPGTLFGGTWEIIEDGRVLKGISSGTAGTTGGSSTVTLSTSNLPAHTHTYDKVNANTDSHVLTINEIPSHTHNFVNGGYAVVVLANSAAVNEGAGIYFADGAAWYQGKTTSSAISTSGGGQGHTHPISTTSTNTGSAGSSNPTAISVQDPYVTVYMWRRIK